MGRPDQVQLIFNRRVNRRTPSRYRTRVITDGVIPSLHFDYKRSRIKQYYKEGRALRTETVINDTYDFGIGRRLRNLDDLKKIGFAANRRLLGVQTLSHDCTIGADVLDGLHRPAHIDGQRASALRFGDPRVQALCAAAAGGGRRRNRSVNPVWTWERANRTLALSTASTGRMSLRRESPGPDWLAVRTMLARLPERRIPA